MGLRSIVLNLMTKLLLVAIMALLVAGAVERERLFWLLGLVIVLRGGGLWREWRKLREGSDRWRELEQAEEREWCEARRAMGGGDVAVPDPAEVTGAWDTPEARAEFARRHARRADVDIWSEALSLVVTAPGAFLLALMLTSPVVTWTGSDRGPGALALAAGVGLHFLANVVPSSRPGRRVWLRAILMAAVCVPFLIVAKTRHPYLLVSGMEHRRMVAERVWNLGKTVQAGRHAGALAAYAKDLEAERRWADARVLYERALSLDARHEEAGEGLARVLEQLGEHDAAAEARRAALATTATGNALAGERADERAENAGLPLFDGSEPWRLRVCLVPMGDVPDSLLDAAGRRMERVLGAEVFRWPETLPLPKADRRAALLGAGQWQPLPLWRVFAARLEEASRRGRRASGTWQFILVTSGDLYLPDTNYVFGVSFPVHGVVSFARFGDAADSRRAERLAKQLVATSIKNFGVGQAGRADCVTAYVRSLDEFDRKPITPAGPTLAEYRRRVAKWESDPSVPPEPPR